MCIWPQVVAEDMPVFVLAHRIARYSGRSTDMFLDEFAVDKALICIIVIPIICVFAISFCFVSFSLVASNFSIVPVNSSFVAASSSTLAAIRTFVDSKVSTASASSCRIRRFSSQSFCCAGMIADKNRCIDDRTNMTERI